MAYRNDVDYQALINEAVSKGDYKAAAQYERVRNEKIADLDKTGTNKYNAKTTNNYSQYLNSGPKNNVYTWNSEQAALLDKANQNSLDWWGSDAAGQKVLSDANKQIYAQLGSGITYNPELGVWSGVADKPISLNTGVDIPMPSFDYDEWLKDNPLPTFDYEDYLSNNPKPSFNYEDFIANNPRPSFSYDDYVANNPKPNFSYDDYLTTNPKPTYESQYSDKIDALLNQILNREKFSYDLESDPMYQQYKAQYNREGQRAMNDTLASMASGAGGMNTWAVTAAQQANDYYNAQLNDRVPELYQLAYQMYLQDIDNQVQDLGLLQQMDNTQYGRYQDTMNDWRNDRDFVYGNYRDQVGDWNNGLNFAYGSYRDQMGDWQTNYNNVYGQYRDQTSDWYNDYNNVYGNYRDQVSDWQDNRNFVYTDYRDDMGDYRWGTEFNYNAELDEYNKQWQQKEWDYNAEQKALDRAESNQKDAYERAMDMLLMGVMPNSDLLAKAGITSAEANAIKAANTEPVVAETPKANPKPGKAPVAGGDDKKAASNDKENYDPRLDKPKPTGTGAVSDRAKQIAKSLQTMTGQMGSEKYIANSIAVYVDDENLSETDARWLFNHFGYDPNEWLE